MSNVKYYALSIGIGIALGVALMLTVFHSKGTVEYVKGKTDTLRIITTQPPLIIEGEGQVTFRTKLLHDTIITPCDTLDYTADIFNSNKSLERKIIKFGEVQNYILTKPFTSEIDTIARGDSIRSSYAFPENLLSTVIRFRPDTILSLSRVDTMIIHKKWHITIGLGAGGGLVGSGWGNCVGVFVGLSYSLMEL
jgi:hypothetical protein